MADKKGPYPPPSGPSAQQLYAQQGIYPTQYAVPQYPAYAAYGQPQDVYVQLPQYEHGMPLMAQPMTGAPPMYGATYQAYASIPHQGPPPPYTACAQQAIPSQQQHLVMAPNAFDAGARFDGIAQPRIPPPPPGVAPNAAQLAAMQGHTVVGTQQSADWFTGGKGGGYTWW
ncbi:hypothetical protein CHS0354_005257 [Potamilus streckersoni]|uniref:DAZ-associated protein 2 n=1 Tax=Potamilus streckersoni TaxID=2493646 RepID=A0AAE0S390_9BIVA|nr:hypothetical protein CHS0354_005257 [Potamilus streckersoni]